MTCTNSPRFRCFHFQPSSADWRLYPATKAASDIRRYTGELWLVTPARQVLRSIVHKAISNLTTRPIVPHLS